MPQNCKQVLGVLTFRCNNADLVNNRFEFDLVLQAEAEVGNLSRRLQLEDEELERAQTRVEELQKKLEEIEVISDENQR